MQYTKSLNAEAAARRLSSETAGRDDTPFIVTTRVATRDIAETKPAVHQINTSQAAPQVISNGISSVRLDGGNITITACETLSFVCGDATMTLKKDGTIEIGGLSKALIRGGDSAIELTASGATLAAPTVDITGAETTQIVGKLVKIN